MNTKLFKTLCKMDDWELRTALVKYLESAYGKSKVTVENNYVIAEGDLPICLLAHTDTVHKYYPEEVYYDQKKKVFFGSDGLGADDRAGVCMILEVLKAGLRPHVIFTDLEESGGIGASDLIKAYPKCPFECKCLIELDRANKKDIVTYCCDNKELVDYFEEFGFEEAWGTYTDIATIMPEWGIAGCNLSVGYFNEHTKAEILNERFYNLTLNKVIKILNTQENMPYFAFVNRNPVASRCMLCGAPINQDPLNIMWDNFNLEVCPSCHTQYAPKHKYNVNF